MGYLLVVEPIEAIVILGGIILIGLVLWYFFGKSQSREK